MSTRRFLVPESELASRRLTLGGADAHHIRRVLRLHAGDSVRLFDGKGSEFEAVIQSCGPQRVDLKVLRRCDSRTESTLSLTVAQSLLKDRKMDRLVRQLTELGMHRWVPFVSERSVPRPDPARFSSRIQRWENIATHAAQQSGRTVLPAIETVAGFDDVLGRCPRNDLSILFWENATTPLAAAWPPEAPPPQRVLVVIGPEGGLTNAEAQRASASGCVCVSLGPRILRAETSAVTACSLVQHRFGDMK
jgi:16S rRNA (uracil1498-N3)-methyltransferase